MADPSTVVAAVLIAAVLHAVWNAIAHATTNRLLGFAIMSATFVLAGAVLVLVASAPARASWVLLGTSAVLHTAYNSLLMLSYRLGDFGQMYPVARGMSPWLVAVGAYVFLSEPLTTQQVVGVAAISGGLLLLIGRPRSAERRALLAAAATGVVIAAYTVVDGTGIRRAASVAGYTGWLFLLQGLAFVAIALVVTRGRPQVAPRELSRGAVVGVLSMAAYALVLWAQTRGALAPIAALRETSVVIGALIATVRFHESFGARRVAAAVLVAGGVIAISA